MAIDLDGDHLPEIFCHRRLESERTQHGLVDVEIEPIDLEIVDLDLPPQIRPALPDCPDGLVQNRLREAPHPQQSLPEIVEDRVEDAGHRSLRGGLSGSAAYRCTVHRTRSRCAFVNEPSQERGGPATDRHDPAGVATGLTSKGADPMNQTIALCLDPLALALLAGQPPVAHGDGSGEGGLRAPGLHQDERRLREPELGRFRHPQQPHDASGPRASARSTRTSGAQIEGKGSSTAPPALIAGTAQIGPMSRPMKPTELDEFEKKYGYKPMAVAVAIDALEVFVNKDNPMTKLTIPQVDAIFSETRLCGEKAAVATWGDLGAKDVWMARPISLYGRNSASGTYGYFKEHALCKGDYRDTVKEQPGSASVVQGISADSNGIGYSGMGYRTSSVKPVALAAKPGSPYVPADPENVYAGKYPLSRFLYLYVNKAPNKTIDPLVRQFLLYVLSKPGQEVVVKDGYLPLTAALAEREREKLD